MYRETTVELKPRDKPRGDEAKIQINDLEHEEAKNNQSEQKEHRIQENEDSVSSPWENFKHSNICIIGVPEREEKRQEIINLFEKIMKENFSNLGKEVDIHVQEARRVPNKMDARRPTPRHTIIRMPSVRDKERILQAAREKHRLTYKEVLCWEQSCLVSGVITSLTGKKAPWLGDLGTISH